MTFTCAFSRLSFNSQGPKVQQKTKEQKMAAALAGGKAKKKAPSIAVAAALKEMKHGARQAAGGSGTRDCGQRQRHARADSSDP